MPEKPKHVDEELKKFSKTKLPHFFTYAKDKEEHQVSPINNSTVNMLNDIIPNTRIKFKDVSGEFDFKLLLNNKRINENLNQELIKRFTEINRAKRLLKNKDGYNFDGFNRYLKSELLKINSNESYVCDVLTYHLYHKGNKNKETLWDIFGDNIYNNLVSNLGNTIQCVTCTNRFTPSNNRQEYCDTCKKEINKIKTKERVLRHKKNKG